MRALARAGAARARTYASGASRIFYAQAKYMENFEDDFEGTCDYVQYFPTYEDMSTYQLRCYFGWRTRLRKGEASPAPTSFLFLHAYELLCGIGSVRGEQGFAELKQYREQYAAVSQAFDVHMRRWTHDYAVFYGIDPKLVDAQDTTSIIESVEVLRRAETSLLAQKHAAAWPERPLDSLPAPLELLDALMKLSRYRAERSRFIRDHMDDVAWVACRVFAHMVDHCHKRRKTDYVDGLFGTPTLSSYTMFPSAIFFSEKPHEDTTYVLSPSEAYVCERGFWWRKLPCRRTETNRELGALMHAIDARMRKAFDDKHPLKEKSLPKYQAKFVDEEIQALLDTRAEQEAKRVRIDLTALEGIRSAAVRTREALLTEDELEDEPTVELSADDSEVPVRGEDAQKAAYESAEESKPILGLDERQRALLHALVQGESIAGFDALFLSLAVDAINDAFLDEVGDTVIEYDGDAPRLVEDYEDDVRAMIL